MSIVGHLSFAMLQLKLNTEQDGESVAEKIRDFDILETLELRRPELRRALWSDLFTGRLKEEIPKTLKTLCTAMSFCGARLVELDLSDNAIGPMAVPGIKEYLSSVDACELSVLKLNNCGLGIAGVTIAECLMECHRKSLEFGTPLRLKTFIAGRNRLEYTSTTALAKAFKQIGTLEEIVMPQNGIKAEGIINLADAVRGSPYLKVLNLNDNTFGEKGAMAMAQAVSSLTSLESVDFGDCLCRNKGSKEICIKLVRSGSALKQLNLSGNEITYDTAKELISQVKQIDSMESLKLGTNSFGGQFGELEVDSQTITFLDVGNESDDQGSLSGDEEGDEISNGRSADEEDDDH
uniref:Ran GTPase activating protein 1 n=1 Tax=Ditylenchus dipsaci TaxID=166011 RepID=A0A915EP04_9BILA